MFQWLSRFFCFCNPEATPLAVAEPCVMDQALVPDIETPASTNPTPLLPAEAAAFLAALLSTSEQSIDLHRLSHDDREFISENLRKVRLNRVEIPILPSTTQRIQVLIANPEARISEIAAIFKDDPTLSAELLRLANSTYIAYLYPTLDLHQAIVRVGFTQLHGLVIMFSIRSRILQGKWFKDEVLWLTELSLNMGKICQLLAHDLGIPPEEAFTLGLMHHIEHLVIVGEACRTTSLHHGRPVSRQAIIEAAHLIGGPLHEIIMKSWGMDSFTHYYRATSGENESDPCPQQDSGAVSILQRLDLLQQLVIMVMAGNAPDLSIDGFDRERLSSAIETVLYSSDNDVANQFDQNKGRIPRCI